MFLNQASVPTKSAAKNILPLAVLLAACSTTSADIHFNNFKLSPFVGIDAGRSRVELQEAFGGKIFRPNATFYNFFGGLDFNDYFGVELGYQRDNTRRDMQSLVTGDIIMGNDTVTSGSSPFDFNTLLKAKHRYLGITAQYPIFENLFATIMIGVSKTKIEANSTTTAIAGIQQTQTDIDDFLDARTYNKSKVIPMLRLGTKYNIHKNFSLRANITWAGTSKIKINSDQNGQLRPNLIPIDNAPDYSIRLKNSVQYSIGVVAHLF